MAYPKPPVMVAKPERASKTTLEVAVTKDIPYWPFTTLTMMGTPSVVPAGRVWYKVPLVGELEFTPTDSTETLTAFGEVANYVARTGRGGMLSFATAGRISDPAVNLIHTHAHNIGDKAVLTYRIKYPEGSWRYGHFVAMRPKPLTESRGVFKYRLEGHLTGPQHVKK